MADTVTLSKTIEVSKTKNNKHVAVYLIEKVLKTYGMYTKPLDRSAGTGFVAGINRFMQSELGIIPDSKVSAKGRIWKKILGIK